MTLKYRWVATFEDGTEIVQPDDDRYSKHDDGADHNPSAFRDILDYEKVSKLRIFTLIDSKGEPFADIDLNTRSFWLNGTNFRLEDPFTELTDTKLIYYRSMSKDFMTGRVECLAYNFGYEGKDEKGKVIKKVVTLR